MMRLLGGGMYLVGFIIMAFNLAKTALAGKAVDGETRVVVEVETAGSPEPSLVSLILARPLLITVAAILVMLGIGASNPAVSIACLVGFLVVSAAGLVTYNKDDGGKDTWHRIIEGRAAIFSVLTVLGVLVGGIVELVPVVVIHGNTADPKKFPPYRALELEGRDIYVREGCYTCHSQMIRPFFHETLRYGAPSTPDESAWDHPFQWGSKRTGPDLARVGTKYPNVWHYKHMTDPRAISPKSIMPPYAWLSSNKVDISQSGGKLGSMKTIGVPYSDADIAGATADARAQGLEIAADLRTQGVEVAPDSEMVAIVAYLQRLGKPSTKPATAPVAMEHTP